MFHLTCAKCLFFLFENMFVSTAVKARECNVNRVSKSATFNKFFWTRTNVRVYAYRCIVSVGNNFVFLRSADRASQYDLFQMYPTRCTLLLSIFTSTSLHVSGNCVPIIRRTYCIYATLVFFTLFTILFTRTIYCNTWTCYVSFICCSHSVTITIVLFI